MPLALALAVTCLEWSSATSATDARQPATTPSHAKSCRRATCGQNHHAARDPRMSQRERGRREAARDFVLLVPGGHRDGDRPALRSPDAQGVIAHFKHSERLSKVSWNPGPCSSVPWVMTG